MKRNISAAEIHFPTSPVNADSDAPNTGAPHQTPGPGNTHTDIVDTHQANNHEGNEPPTKRLKVSDDLTINIQSLPLEVMHKTSKFNPEHSFLNFTSTDRFTFKDRLPYVDLRLSINQTQEFIEHNNMLNNQEGAYSQIRAKQDFANIKTLTLEVSSNSDVKEVLKALPNLTTLQLEICGDTKGSTLKNILAAAKDLPKLTHLALYSTNGGPHTIDELPPKIGKLTQLQQLTLSKLGIEWIPYEIGNLTQLQQLTLSSLSIDELPKEIGDLTQLQQLTLHELEIEAIPEEICYFSRLQQLTLSNLGSEEQPIETLPTAIGNLSQLQQLTLSNIAIKTLPTAIGNLNQLQQLTLSSLNIKELPEAIGNLNQLQTLVLDDLSLHSVPIALIHIPQLQVEKNSTDIDSIPPGVTHLFN